VVVLFAGSVPDGEAVISLSSASIAGLKSVAAISEKVAENYRQIKMKRVEEGTLLPILGINFSGFQHLVAQSPTSQMLQQVLGAISQHNLGLDLLVAGIDDSGAHLFAVTHPGIAVPLDTVSYAATGGGGIHAGVRLSLGRQYKTATVSETLFNVYEAKLSAEVAPGVGKTTDIAIVRQSGVTFLESSACDTLASLHQERPALSPEQIAQLDALCAEV
jgi:hypothetical protein